MPMWLTRPPTSSATIPPSSWAALLTSVLDNTDKVIEYTAECARLGIKVLPPDINRSAGGFTADGEGRSVSG